MRIPNRHVACSDHWAMVPKWLQVQLIEQLHYGIAWKCHPTQQYIELRTKAIHLVNEASAKRFAKPEPDPQLPLLPST